MSKTITSLQIQKRNKERVNVFINEEFAFGLNLMAAAGLRKGQSLTDTEIVQLQQADEAHIAYQQAISYLGYRPRSVAEISTYLKGKEYDEELVEAVVERLRAAGYLDDEAFARFWLENREQFRPRSVRALRYELRQKGIDRAVIDETLTAVDEDASAWAVLEPKLISWQRFDQPTFMQKAMGLLARRGFGYAVARRAARQAWEQVGGTATADDDDFANDAEV